jgi:hypothetical protein
MWAEDDTSNFKKPAKPSDVRVGILEQVHKHMLARSTGKCHTNVRHPIYKVYMIGQTQTEGTVDK